MLTEYETTVVLRPNIGGDAIEATLDKIRSSVDEGGKLLAINHWGKKRLAYEIKKHNRGVYVHTHFLGIGPMVTEIERNLRLSEDVLRYLTVKLADGIEPDSRDSVEYERPEYEEAVDELDEDGEGQEAAPEGGETEAPAEAETEAKPEGDAEAKPGAEEPKSEETAEAAGDEKKED